MEKRREKKKECTILMLGERGVGKSTIINAFANYIKFPTFSEAFDAKETHRLVITPTNALSTHNELCNHSVRYSLETEDVLIRMVDAPGIGDKDGVIKDQQILTNILTQLDKLTKIHAIAIVLRSHDLECPVVFEYCVKQLLSLIHRDAIGNIVFLFTNSPENSNTISDTKNRLQAILTEIKETTNLNIPFNQMNTLFIDNECFYQLLSTEKRKSQKTFEKSWDKAVLESKRLLEYVLKLKPMDTQSFVSLMETRKLRKPLVDVLALIETNLSQNKRLEDKLKRELKVSKEASVERNFEENRNKKVEIETEKKIIQNAVSTFTCYLGSNSIILFNNIYGEYMRFLIDEKEFDADHENLKIIANNERLIATYELEERSLMEALRNIEEAQPASAAEIMDSVKQLYGLKGYGKLIEDLCNDQHAYTTSDCGCNIDIMEVNLEPIQSVDDNDNNEFTQVKAEADVEKKEHNILIFGETGVGKSTFINAFANYLNFPTFIDARNAKEIHTLIPTRFLITDVASKAILIQVGEDKNESFEEGQSCTQFYRSYIFETDQAKIRFIDTPGIGDTRGVEKDKENIFGLVDYLGQFKEINAIAILLKPNQSRITTSFNYCLKQLLSSLHQSAVNNIIFIFTNSRATFYRIGDTIVPLQTILNEIANSPPHVHIPFNQNNTFCLDNESFRYLLAIRQNVLFTKHVEELFEHSWNESAAASGRLLDYIQMLKPHPVLNTISVMKARHQILLLRRPMAEISMLIQRNLDRIKDDEDNLNKKDKSIESLKPYLYKKQMKLKAIGIGHPQTVCQHSECVEFANDSHYHHKQICHENCYLGPAWWNFGFGVPENSIGDLRICLCEAMTLKIIPKLECTCKVCGHSYRDHAHIYYHTEMYEETVKNENIDMEIGNVENQRRVVEDTLQRLKHEKEEFEKEKDTIRNCVAKFFHFLINNAVIPENDAYRDYLQRLIILEKQKKNNRMIELYEKEIALYESEKDILMDELSKIQETNKDVKSVVEPQDIIKIVEELFKLSFSGSFIKSAYDEQKKHKKHEYVNGTEKIVEPLSTWGKIKSSSSKYKKIFLRIGWSK